MNSEKYIFAQLLQFVSNHKFENIFRFKRKRSCIYIYQKLYIP